MGIDYDCFKLRNNYRGIGCKPCAKPPRPPCKPNGNCFQTELINAVMRIIGCMACQPCVNRGLSICVKAVDQFTHVPICGYPITLINCGEPIAALATDSKGTARFNDLPPGVYSIAYGACIGDSFELSQVCPYIMLVINVSESCPPQMI